MQNIFQNFLFDILENFFSFFLSLGRKSGKGCYVYQPGLKSREVNPEIGEILEKYKIAPNPAVWVDTRHLNDWSAIAFWQASFL